jgi:hypothetical protein
MTLTHAGGLFVSGASRKAARRLSPAGGKPLLELGRAASLKIYAIHQTLRGMPAFANALIVVGQIRWPRPSFQIGADTCAFFPGCFASKFKHSVRNFRSDETLKILPDCGQYVGNFLIGGGHCFKSLWIKFCRSSRNRNNLS